LFVSWSGIAQEETWAQKIDPRDPEMKEIDEVLADASVNFHNLDLSVSASSANLLSSVSLFSGVWG